MRRLVVLVVATVVLATSCFKAYDFNGDNKADYVWRDQTTGVWYEGSVPNAVVCYQGAPTDEPVPADYDGDGRADIAVVKANGDWVKADGTVIKAAFPRPTGANSAPTVPVPADYNGDRKAEPAWFRATDGTWIFADGTTASISGGPTNPATCCLLNNDARVPVPADYDGDLKTDLAVWNPLTGDWTIRRSSDGGVQTVHVMDRMSSASVLQLPVPGDYDGVGHAQAAIVDSHGWHIAGHTDVVALPAAKDLNLPAVADYDGDGKDDLGVVGLDGQWYVPGQPTLTINGGAGPSDLVGLPAETPMRLIENVAHLTLLGRNLIDCENGVSVSTCAGF